MIRLRPQGSSVYAEAAIAVEASTGLILYEKNIHEPHYPASITKSYPLCWSLRIAPPRSGHILKNAIFNIERDSTHIE